MFIKRINGETCDKIVGDAKFANIRWLRKCLFTVLMALDEAQKLLGFQYVVGYWHTYLNRFCLVALGWFI